MRPTPPRGPHPVRQMRRSRGGGARDGEPEGPNRPPGGARRGGGGPRHRHRPRADRVPLERCSGPPAHSHSQGGRTLAGSPEACCGSEAPSGAPRTTSPGTHATRTSCEQPASGTWASRPTTPRGHHWSRSYLRGRPPHPERRELPPNRAVGRADRRIGLLDRVCSQVLLDLSGQGRQPIPPLCPLLRNSVAPLSLVVSLARTKRGPTGDPRLPLELLATSHRPMPRRLSPPVAPHLAH